MSLVEIANLVPFSGHSGRTFVVLDLLQLVVPTSKQSMIPLLIGYFWATKVPCLEVVTVPTRVDVAWAVT